MNINGLKQDYGFLFSSSEKKSNDLLSSINLSDYNTIKSGTYGKLLKAYYKKEDAESTDKTSDKSGSKTETEFSKKLKVLQTEAKGLGESAAKLMQKGSKSVFKTEDMEKVYSAVSDFINDYNTVIEKAEETGSKSLMRKAEGMTKLAGDYKKELEEMGITKDQENRLKIDKDLFLKSDMDQVKSLFHEKNSFGYLASLRAVEMENSAYSEINRENLYKEDGTYSSISTTDLFNSIV